MKIKLSKSTKNIIQLVILLIVVGFVMVLLYKNFNKPENKDYIFAYNNNLKNHYLLF